MEEKRYTASRTINFTDANENRLKECLKAFDEIFDDIGKNVSHTENREQHSALDSILEFRSANNNVKNVFYRDETGKFTVPASIFCGSVTTEQMLEDKNFCISKIRNSNGDTFEVGEKTNKGIIAGFEYHTSVSQGDKILAYTGEFDYDIKELKKVEPEPLFVTEDGKSIYKGDPSIFFILYPEDNFQIIEFNPSGQNIFIPCKGSHLKFSTREAAEQYITDNKPLFSRKEMIDFGAQRAKNISDGYNELATTKTWWPIGLKSTEEHFEKWLIESNRDKAKTGAPGDWSEPADSTTY